MNKTIMIFDRQAIARRLLRFALELQGFLVIEMGDRFGALETLASSRPDLLVIGVDPTDSGRHDLAVSVRRRPGLEELPILFVGERPCRERMDLRAIGNCAWMDKPFRMLDLYGHVEGLLGCAPLAAAQNNQRRAMVQSL